MSTLIVPLVQIESIEKHPNADTLMIAKFVGFGWQSIIKVDQYQVGDWVIFVPPDSILPNWIVKDQEITYLKSKKNRVGAVKLRGVVSEGIVLPPTIMNKISHPTRIDAGENVAAILGIEKYEPPEPAFATRPKAIKNRPYNNATFPKYTDIQHYKNFPEALVSEEYVVVTEKIHGTNFRVGWALKQRLSLWDRIAKFLNNFSWFVKWFGGYNPYYFTCGSRQVEMGVDRPKTTWYDKGTIERKEFEFNLYQRWGEKLREVIPRGYIFYGEIYGDKVQDLTYGLSNGKTDVVFFDIMKDGKYLSYLDFLETLPKGLNSVPVLYVGKLWPGILDRLSEGNSALALLNYAEQMREGVVVRPFAERIDSVFGRAIYKVINTDYLNRKGGTEYK